MVFVPTAPFAEFFVYPRIIDPNDAAATARNIVARRELFVAGILAHP